MKLKIITLHSIYNPGSVFQAYALQHYLLKEGYDVEIIDYRPPYGTIGKNKIKGYLRKMLFFKNEIKVKRKYEKFINDTMFLTASSYHSFNDLVKFDFNADVYITGSDQLWNMDYDCGRDLSYYLEFVDGKKKISYATSIGKKIIPNDELNLIASRIQDFSMISVREESNSYVLSDKLQRKVSWVCDPVFLLSADDYKGMTSRQIKGKYVVVYLSEKSDLLNCIVNDVKNKTEFEVVLIGGNRTRCVCDRHIKDLGPYDFLSLILHAEIVISSSFHATAFSLIFNKKFGVILPKKNGERIESMLNLCRLTNHIISNESDIVVIYEKINYSEINKELEKFISISKNILLQGIQN